MRPGHPCRAPGPAWPRPHPQRRDTQWPLRTSVSHVLEPLPAALRLLWAASVLPRKERSTWPRPPGARLPGAQSQSTACGGILGGGAHACSGPAAPSRRRGGSARGARRPALSSCRSQTWGPAEATAQRTSPSAPCPLLAGDLFPLGSVLLGGGLGGPGRGPAGVSHCSEGWDPRFQTVRRSSENSFV